VGCLMLLSESCGLLLHFMLSWVVNRFCCMEFTPAASAGPSGSAPRALLLWPSAKRQTAKGGEAARELCGQHRGHNLLQRTCMLLLLCGSISKISKFHWSPLPSYGSVPQRSHPLQHKQHTKHNMTTDAAEHILQLPDDVLGSICTLLPRSSLNALRLSCRQFKDAADQAWETLAIQVMWDAKRRAPNSTVNLVSAKRLKKLIFKESSQVRNRALGRSTRSTAWARASQQTLSDIIKR
jgi:hypothetical protein